MDRNKVANLIANLDHPDTVQQQEIVDRLVTGGDAVVEVVAASIALYEQPRVLNALIQVLGRIGDAEALITLMRFVFDHQGKIFAADARALAMKAIAEIAQPEDAKRVFSFLQDTMKDADPFVRGYSAKAMAKFGDSRAMPFLEMLATDDDDFVRERATEALGAIRDTGLDVLRQSVSDDELIALIIANKGVEQEFYVNELRSRDNAAKIAETMITRGHPARLRGLQVLLECGATPESGPIVAAVLAGNKVPASEIAMALRVFTQTLDGNCSENEIQMLRKFADSEDRYIRIAAIEAGARSGDEMLQDAACDTIELRADFDAMIASAKGLSAGLNEQDRRLFPRLEQLFTEAQKSRLDKASPENVALEGYLVRAIRRVLADGRLGASRGQAIALRALLDARDKRPLFITALELLDATTPVEGLPEGSRWQRSLAFGLVDLADHADRDVRNRALDLLVRGVSKGSIELVEPLSRLIFERDLQNLTTRILPLLERAGDSRALNLLKELRDNADSNEIRLAAAAAMQRVRFSQDYVDAEFE